MERRRRVLAEEVGHILRRLFIRIVVLAGQLKREITWYSRLLERRPQLLETQKGREIANLLVTTLFHIVWLIYSVTLHSKALRELRIFSAKLISERGPHWRLCNQLW